MRLRDRKGDMTAGMVRGGPNEELTPQKSQEGQDNSIKASRHPTDVPVPSLHIRHPYTHFFVILHLPSSILNSLTAAW